MSRNVMRGLKKILMGMALFSGLASGAAAQAHAEAVFIVDFSRSMWNKIDGTSKFIILREALKQVFTQYNRQLDAAIITIGSTSRSACDDVQELKSKAQVDDSYATALDPLKPTGQAPIAAALEKAQTLLLPGGRTSTIILIADGADNCKGDPCAAARSIAEKSPGAKIHVIGFDARAKETTSMLSCVAQATSGLYLTATSRDELDTALQQAMTASPTMTLPAIANRPGPQSQIGLPTGAIDAAAASFDDSAAQPHQAPPRTGPPSRVTLTASLAEGSPALADGLHWRIFDSRPAEDGSYKLVKMQDDARLSVELPPGEYLVNAAYGRANLTKKLAVWPGKPITDSFVLNAGGLRLSAMLANGQMLPDNLVKFDILSETTDQFGNRERVMENVRPGIVIRLNSGYYHVVSTYGDANAKIESDVVIEPGKLTEAIAKHDAAKATFRLVDRPGGEALADTRWTIQTPEGEVIKESAGAFPSHILAAGSYKVTATHGDKEYSRSFTLNPGEIQQVEVVTQPQQ